MREQLPRLRTEADRAALLANLICEAFGNYMGVVTEESALPPLAQLQVWPAVWSQQCAVCGKTRFHRHSMAPSRKWSLRPNFRWDGAMLSSDARPPTTASLLCWLLHACFAEVQLFMFPLQAAFGKGPVPVGELVAAGLGGARSRAIAFKAIADGLPPQYRLRTRLVRAPYPQVRSRQARLAECPLQHF